MHPHLKIHLLLIFSIISLIWLPISFSLTKSCKIKFNNQTSKEVKSWAQNFIGEKDQPYFRTSDGNYGFVSHGDKLFLYTSITVGHATIQSILLRTVDNGSSWNEVMPAIHGSEIVQMQILESGIGWAMTLWNVEGSGDIKLAKTYDAGESWKMISNIKKANHSAEPLWFNFTNSESGKIAIEINYSIPGIDGYYEQSTIDGGYTWALTKKLSLKQWKKQKKSTPSFPVKNNPFWRLKEKNDLISIQNRQSIASAWRTVCNIHNKLKYKDGVFKIIQ